MTRPRETLISLVDTPYYHCVSRCVRRAFLCGSDDRTGQSYEHRRQWLEERIQTLGQTFAIDVCAYAVMSNHTHLVLHVDRDRARAWDDQEVMERWLTLFSGNPLAQRKVRGETLLEAEDILLRATVAEWRGRLQDISWLMRCLNEPIARRANAEDQCTGRFWEGRFKVQALLDEAALAACLAYVDLNPIRAGLADTPEASDYTSLQQRIQAALSQRSEGPGPCQPQALFPFAGNPRADMPEGLPFRLEDYLQLVDWTGRILRDDKRGAIPESAPPIFERLRIEPRHWLYLTGHFESRLKGLVGAAHRIRAACRSLGKRWAHGTLACQQLFPT